MQITKIAGFEPNEVDALAGAGNILGVYAKAYEAGEFSELDDEGIALIKALAEVVARFEITLQ